MVHFVYIIISIQTKLTFKTKSSYYVITCNCNPSPGMKVYDIKLVLSEIRQVVVETEYNKMS